MLVQFVYGLGESADGKGLGLRAFSEKIRSRINNVVVAYDAWSDDVWQGVHEYHDMAPREPIILIAHSYGNAAIARAFASQPVQVPIKHWFLLDPVPRWGWGQFQSNSFVVPANVENATCFYRKAILPPWSSPIKNESEKYKNVRIQATTHNAIPSLNQVQIPMLIQIAKYAN